MTLADGLKMLRPHQWSKNVLTLIPVIAAGRWADAPSWAAAAIAFAAFSLIASSGYVLNDLKDVKEDREHPAKQHRPIAAGKVGRGAATSVGIVLAALALGLASLAGRALAEVVLVYFVATLVYTAILRQYFLADAMAIAGLFTLRIVGGCAAIGVRPSIWLLSLTMFVFFSLALTKRYRELALNAEAPARRSARDYGSRDMDLIRSLGLTSATVAALVVALYLESARALEGYKEPGWLWFACPVIWYWLIRIWSKCDRGELDEDPVLYALKDRGSWVCLAAIIMCWLAAVLGLPSLIGR